jgi:alpha-D-ribose 1-methylphosphonate 5-triphosphate diphosphatase
MSIRIYVGSIALDDCTNQDCILTIRENKFFDIENYTKNSSIDIDLSDYIIIPGFVDLHNDYIETIYHPRPSVILPYENSWIFHDIRCISSGITTIFNCIRFEEVPSKSRSISAALELLRSMQKVKQDLLANHFVHARLDITLPNVAEVMEEIACYPEVKIASLMLHAPGFRQFKTRESFKKFYTGAYNMSKHDILRWEERVKGSLPSINKEALKISKLCKKNKIVLATHDDTEFEDVEWSHSLGSDISEFPTTIHAAKRANSLGLRVLLGAPNLVLGKSHAGNLSASEAIDTSVLDMLASDFSPETMLLALWKLHESMPLNKACNYLCGGANNISQFRGFGKIIIGNQADFTVVKKMENKFVICQSWIKGKCIYNTFR